MTISNKSSVINNIFVKKKYLVIIMVFSFQKTCLEIEKTFFKKLVQRMQRIIQRCIES